MGKTTYSLNNSNDQHNLIPLDIANKILVDKDLAMLKKAMQTLTKKYSVSPEQIAKLADDNIEIPLSIYNDKNLSTLESTVRYLKDSLNLRYSEIGILLNRNERTIWVTYRNSVKKSSNPQKITSGPSIPIKIFSERKFGVLESAVSYLKETHSMRFSEISRIFCIDQRTVWTCYNRCKNKRCKK